MSAPGGGTMSAHAHDWAPGVAPEYVCDCGAVGIRRLPSTRRSAILAVAETAEDAALRDRGYEMRAEAEMAESEGRPWAGREPDETLAVDEYMAAENEEERMGRRAPITRHRWAEADDEALRDAVAVVYGDDDAERSPKVASWSAVAGRLLPNLVVTPAACRARWAVVLEQEREAVRAAQLARMAAEARADEMDAAQREAEAGEAARVVVEPDAWETLRLRIEEYEANEEAEVTASLAGIRDALGEQRVRMERIEAAVARLEAMWR